MDKRVVAHLKRAVGMYLFVFLGVLMAFKVYGLESEDLRVFFWMGMGGLVLYVAQRYLSVRRHYQKEEVY